jgi:hypothetical protein
MSFNLILYVCIYADVHLIRMQFIVHLQLLLYVKLNFVTFKVEKRAQMTFTAEVREMRIFDCPGVLPWEC